GSWLHRGVEGVTSVDTCGPGEDRFAAKAANLQHVFRIPIPLIFLAEESETERLAVLVRGTGSICHLLIGKSEIINVEPNAALEAKPVREIEPPKARIWIAVIYSARVLNRADQECGRIPGGTRV